MWIVTEHGFFTFVTDRKDPGYVWLRARIREDLERNFPGIEVTEHPGADYLFRAKVPRQVVADRIAELVMESTITSHFKDVVNQRAAKPKHGSRSAAMYAFWNGMAACQPYAPYSKIPRPEPKPWTPPAPGGTPAGGQGTLFSSNGGRKASDYDWTRASWNRHQPAAPAFAAPVDIDRDPEETLALIQELSDDEWMRLSAEERDALLDAEEAATQALEDRDAALALREEHPGFLEAHGGPEGWFSQPEGAHPAPSRRERRRQAAGIPRDALEDRNRQAYLDKKAKRRKGRKNRHNQQG